MEIAQMSVNSDKFRRNHYKMEKYTINIETFLNVNNT